MINNSSKNCINKLSIATHLNESRKTTRTWWKQWVISMNDAIIQKFNQ